MIIRTAALALLLTVPAFASEGRFVAQCGPAEAAGDKVWTQEGEQVEIVSCAPFVVRYENGTVAEGVPVSPGSVFLPRPMDEV